MHYVLGLSLVLPSLALAAPTLETDGRCPGAVTISITDLTPRATYALLIGTEGGSDAIAYGPCAGTISGLDDGRVGFASSDRDGQVRFSPDIPVDLGGTSLQVLDSATCEFSSVQRVCDPAPLGGGVIFAASSAGSEYGEPRSTGLWAIDPDSGSVTFVGDPGIGFTGLAYVDDTLYAAQDSSGDGIFAIDLEVDPGAATLVGPASFDYYSTVTGEQFLGSVDGQLVTGDYPDWAGTFTPGSGTAVDRSIVLEGIYDYYVLVPAAWGASVVQNSTGTYFVGHGGFGEWNLATGEHTAGPAYSGDLIFSTNGGGATVHQDRIYGAWSVGDQTGLFELDPTTGVVTDTGIRIPDANIDALASTSP